MDKKRTAKQNRSLHLYCRQLGQALNDAGLDAKKTLKPELDIPWDNEGRMIKELIWKPVQEAMTGEESTTEMDTVQPSEIYEVINRHMAEKHGVSVPWPSNEPPMISGN